MLESHEPDGHVLTADTGWDCSLFPGFLILNHSVDRELDFSGKHAKLSIMGHKEKLVIWIGRTLEDLKRFPVEVQRTFGFALYRAQIGKKHPDAKPLRGFGGAGVIEVVEDYHGDTYRAVYTVKFAGVVYTLHAFQKKSKKGRATPKQELELVRARLKVAEQHYLEWSKKE